MSDMTALKRWDRLVRKQPEELEQMFVKLCQVEHRTGPDSFGAPWAEVALLGVNDLLLKIREKDRPTGLALRTVAERPKPLGSKHGVLVVGTLLYRASGWLKETRGWQEHGRTYKRVSRPLGGYRTGSREVIEASSVLLYPPAHICRTCPNALTCALEGVTT